MRAKHGRTDKEWIEFKNQALRTTTNGWINRNTFGFVMLGFFFLTVAFPGFNFLLIGATILFIAWRYSRSRSLENSIQELGRTF